jgi:hypothetical protein
VVIATHNESLVEKFPHPQLRIDRSRIAMIAAPGAAASVAEG